MKSAGYLANAFLYQDGQTFNFPGFGFTLRFSREARMPIVVRQCVKASYYHGSDQLMEAMRATATMRSTAAQYRLVEETRSTIAVTSASIGYADALLRALTFAPTSSVYLPRSL